MTVPALDTTEFAFPGQLSLYHGKVRDVYTFKDSIALVATDRISAFDVILPRAIPFKGQVLNQTAAFFLENTADIVPNWLRKTPDPNVSVGIVADPIKIEMIVRGYLIGSAWRDYAAGKRELCGVALKDGMKEYDAFDSPIITPSTKADEGHDENITPEEIISQGIVSAHEWRTLEKYALKLFSRGQQMAAQNGLLLADTKYEFGRYNDEIILIDEVHTPDSSRYFYAEGFEAFKNGSSDKLPEQLSKEFVRKWLMDNGFNIETGEGMPEMSDQTVDMISERYITLYETVTGRSFKKEDSSDVMTRIERNLRTSLEVTNE